MGESLWGLSFGVNARLTVVLGGQVNASLYTLELLLAWKYWRSSKDDSRLNRATVVGVVLADTVCSFANFYSVRPPFVCAIG